MTRVLASLLLLLLLLATPSARALNAASAASAGDGPGLVGAAGLPDTGLGARVPFMAPSLRLVTGTAFRPSTRAFSVDAGVSWRRAAWRFFSVEAVPTVGVSVPTFPSAALAFRGEALGRGVVAFRWARAWTGVELAGAVQSIPSARGEAGASWVLGGAARLGWLEAGVATSLGARATWDDARPALPSGFRPDARLLFTVDVGTPYRLSRADLPWSRAGR